jgi:hypothetical protein
MMFQFSLPNTEEDEVLLYTLPEKDHAGLVCFLDFLDQYCTNSSVEYLIYGWNISYEFTQILHDMPMYVRQASDIRINNISLESGKKYRWSIEISNEKRKLATFRKGHGVSVKFLDGMAFYNTSLDKAARLVGAGEKYELEGLSRSNFTRADLEDSDYIKYAKRDAYITRRIADHIQLQHRLYQVPTCISAPHFAATVFRTQFLHSGLGVLDQSIEQLGLDSYHGGKNGFYLSEPTDLPNSYLYDITSAYPEAMRQLPDLEKMQWSPSDHYKPNTHSLWYVDVDYRPCIYRGMQNYEGTWLDEPGRIKTAITGYELDQLVSRNEVTIHSATGYVVSGPSGGPLTRYVDRFFHIKSTSAGPERETAKLLLNSLYGKFFQKQNLGSVGSYNVEQQRWIETNPEHDYDFEAGGLYDPAVASLITGYVRAKIHGLEHKYSALMTSTDGLFALDPPEQSDLGNGLGELTSDKGRLRIWRERLYVFDSVSGKKKYALHGFRGKVADLEEIPLVRGTYSYLGMQMITLKMSTKLLSGKSYSPGQFATMWYELNI